jgi:hypothetical protein
MSNQEDREAVLQNWPEAKLIRSGGDRFEAYITLHGEWADSEEDAWKTLKEKLKGRK